MRSTMPIAAALLPVVLLLWWRGSERLKKRLRAMKPGLLRTILLWPSK